MAPRPVTLLITALGGEGGGVLTEWIIAAAAAQDFPAQSTSIPGVAQRTGATSYYVEIMPVRAAELAGRVPVLALTPGIGDIDLMVASELLEANRLVAAGFVTRERTLVVGSTSRAYAMDEKIAMADGRLDPGRLIATLEDHAQQALLFDMEEAAARSGSIISAVMLGAIAGCGRLPIAPEAFEAAIRREGRAVESNLKGFRAGLDAVRQRNEATRQKQSNKRSQAGDSSLAQLERDVAATMPEIAHDVMREGVRRLAAYQDLAYGRLYVDRLGPIRDADAQAGSGGRLLAETARQLAVRMSFEDVIRVAQAKIDPQRFARIMGEMNVAPGEPFAVVEFLKPGIEELCSVLPPRLARSILRLAQRHDWLGRVHLGMEVKTTSVTGYLRLRLLASLRRFRHKSFRYQEEQAEIERWLDLIRRAAALSGDLALEIAACARLIKGYGDTHRRSSESYRLIETRIIAPALAGRLPPDSAIDAVASARTAALADPDGEALSRCLAEIERRAPIRLAAE